MLVYPVACRSDNYMSVPPPDRLAIDSPVKPGRAEPATLSAKGDQTSSRADTITF